MTNHNHIRFLATLWQGGQYSYYWTAPHKISYWLSIDDLSTYQCPNGGQNVYFGVNPVVQIPSKNAQGKPKPPKMVRSQNNYISAVNCLFCEFDFKTHGDTEIIRQHLKSFPFPSVAISSGGGYHFYWLLKKTFTINTDNDREYIKAAQANWVEFIGSDKASKDLARVLRVPGIRNYKPEYKPNYPMVSFVKEDYALKYDLEQLAELSRPEIPDRPEPCPLPDCDGKPGDVLYYRQQALKTAGQMIRDSIDGEKHGTLLRAARLLGGYVAGGIVPRQEAIDVLEYEIGHKPNVDSLDAARTTIEKGLDYGMSEPITLEQKLAEFKQWKQQNGKAERPEPARTIDRAYWSRQFIGMWERVR